MSLEGFFNKKPIFTDQEKTNKKNTKKGIN